MEEKPAASDDGDEHLEPPPDDDELEEGPEQDLDEPPQSLEKGPGSGNEEGETPGLAVEFDGVVDSKFQDDEDDDNNRSASSVAEAKEGAKRDREQGGGQGEEGNAPKRAKTGEQALLRRPTTTTRARMTGRGHQQGPPRARAQLPRVFPVPSRASVPVWAPSHQHFPAMFPLAHQRAVHGVGRGGARDAPSLFFPAPQMAAFRLHQHQRVPLLPRPAPGSTVGPHVGSGRVSVLGPGQPPAFGRGRGNAVGGVLGRGNVVAVGGGRATTFGRGSPVAVGGGQASLFGRANPATVGSGRPSVLGRGQPIAVGNGRAPAIGSSGFAPRGPLTPIALTGPARTVVAPRGGGGVGGGGVRAAVPWRGNADVPMQPPSRLVTHVPPGVPFFRPPAPQLVLPPGSGWVVRVSNLPRNVGERQLAQLMERCGHVLSVSRNGTGGDMSVAFASQQAMWLAKREFHRAVLFGHRIGVFV